MGAQGAERPFSMVSGPGSRTTSGATPLYLAAQQGQAAGAQLLSAQGADTQDSNGATPAYVAAHAGEFKTVRCSFERFRAAEPRSELL